jgi:membrane-associated protein
MRDTFWGMPLWLGVVAAVLIIFVRGVVYYWVGRVLGQRIYTSRAGRRIGEHRLRRVESLVAQRGALAVFAAHWVAGLRHAIPVSAGAMRMPQPRYLAAAALGALLWTPPWVVGGYAVVWGWLKIFGSSPPAVAALVAAAIAVMAALIAVRRRRPGRRPRRPDRDGASDDRDQAGSGSSRRG